MIGLVMCGGKGTRMGPVGEKLLLKYKMPVVQHVIDALQKSGCFSKTVCATSHNAPQTSEFVKGLGMETIETGGGGYVEDLGQALRKFGEHVFVVSGDLALLDAEVVREIVRQHDSRRPWMSVVTSKKFLDTFGITPEFLVTFDGKECAFTGISIVNPTAVRDGTRVDESYILVDDKRVAVNLNKKRDYELLGAS
ncbi:MAG TPA: NTP transferase domain-containing protein [Candidatus Nitrosotalea sp.]|nr:NTP transferase domain-containing protein [Candidatus Nitrosotalea sp.]